MMYFPLYYYSQSGNILSGYYAFYDFINSEIKRLDDKTLELWNTFKEVGERLHYFFVFKDFVFLSEKPVGLHFNSNNQLHNETDAAAYYKDGYSLWCLNGVRVTKELVMTSWDKLDCKLLLKEQNAGIRREFVRKAGIEKVCADLGAKCIDKVGDYELLLLDLQDGRERPYLKMLNPSIGTYHIEGVHPDCKTVEAALKFRNGTIEKPLVLT